MRKAFEEQVLVFPVFVTVLAAVTFLFGGTCGAWQWWVSFGIVMLLPFLRNKRSESLMTDAAFAGLLTLLFVLVSFYTDTYWNCDYPDYHLPATRLLIEGWNPVYDYDLRHILERLNLDPWDMRYSHVLFCQRAVWIFNAVAYKFHHQVFAISWALNPFLLLAAAFAMFRWCGLRDWHWSLGVLLLSSTVLCATFGTPVDDISCYAAAGLLCTMAADYERGKLSWLPLSVFSFWMMNAKSVGLISCFVFWCVFSISMCVKYRRELLGVMGRISALGAILVALLAVTTASPIITSAIHYGHPLYPQMTSQPDVYPAKDLVWTFRIRGMEEVCMDAPSSFLKSYVSQSAAAAYRCVTGIGKGPIPLGLPLEQKILIWVSMLALLVLRRTRMTGCQFLFGLVLFPWVGMGMLRYMPWVGVMIGMALVSVVGTFLSMRMTVWAASALTALLAIKVLPGLLLGEIYGFGETENGQNDASTAVYAYSFDLDPPPDAYNEELGRRHPFIPRQCLIGHSTINNIKLLFKERYGYYPNVVPTPLSYVKCDKTFYRGGYCRLPTHNMTARSNYEKALIAIRKFPSWFMTCLEDLAYRVAIAAEGCS